jgi:hypothetical protein
MRILKVLLLLAALTIASPALSEPEAHLNVSAAPATAAVAQLPAGRNPITLPELEYEFVIDFQCAPPMQAESISISVADSRRTLDAAEIDARSSITSDITVPRKQLSPLALDGFCQVPASDNTPFTELSVTGAFTAHVSLLCTGDAQQSILYAAQALDLNLQCVHPDEDGTSTDQGTSTSPTER